MRYDRWDEQSMGQRINTLADFITHINKGGESPTVHEFIDRSNKADEAAKALEEIAKKEKLKADLEAAKNI